MDSRPVCPPTGGDVFASHTPPPGDFLPTQVHDRVTINNLPNELFVKIILDVGTLDHGGYGHWMLLCGVRRLRSVMATCREWRDIICGTPAFWCRVVVNCSLEWLTLCLQRSQQALIEVEFCSPTTDLSQVWHTLVPHKDRIASLEFHRLQCAHIGDHMAFDKMLQLKSLIVVLDHAHAANPTKHNGIFPSLLLAFPRLENLVLFGLAVTGPSASGFSTLRKLVLDGYPHAPKTIGLTQFLATLQACVSLEQLQLWNYSLDPIVFDIPQIHPMVALPRLRNLTIFGKVEEVSNLLSHLELGSDVNIMLGTDPQEDEERALVAPRTILPADLSRCRIPILRTATRLKIDLCWDTHEEALVITATRGLNPNDRLTFILRISEEQWVAEVGPASADALDEYFGAALRRIPEIFSDAPLETLFCYGEMAVVEADVWQSLFASFPTLRTLVIDGAAHGDMQTVFRALGSQQSPEDPRPVCPRLEYIWYRTDLDTRLDRLEDVRQCLAWRAACQAPLRRLRLELIPDEDIIAEPIPFVSRYREEFKRLVADSTLVIWDPRNEHDMKLLRQSDPETEHPFDDLF